MATIIASTQAMLVAAGVHLTGSRLSFMGVFALAGDTCGQAIMSLVFTRLGPRRMMVAILGVLAAAALLFAGIRRRVTRLRGGAW